MHEGRSFGFFFIQKFQICLINDKHFEETYRKNLYFAIFKSKKKGKIVNSALLYITRIVCINTVSNC